MSCWDDITRALEDVNPICPGRVAAAALWKAVAANGVEGADAGGVPGGVMEAVCTIGRAWLVRLDRDPNTSRTSLERATAFCQGVRAAHGRSAFPLRHARVELSVALGLRDETLEQLREARLFPLDKTNTGVVLTTTRMYDDYSGVVSTTTVTSKRAEADPVESARGLGTVLVLYLAHQHIVKAEGTFASLSLLRLPDVVSLQSLANRLEYLGLSSRWQRATVLIRHSPMKAVSEVSAWQLMNTAVGLALVMRAANRTDYGEHTLGTSLSWTTPWGDLGLTAQDTVGRACDVMTDFVRGVAHRFDVRNGNNDASYRVEIRMTAEAVDLVSRSYGTVTNAVPADRARLRNQGALLKEVRGLLTLPRGYGVEPMRQRAMSTAETISASLSEVVDSSTLELIVDFRLAFDRLLVALDANKRAEKEHLDTVELNLSQG